MSRPTHDTPTLPVPPPDGVATGVRVLESQARDARTWAALSQEQQTRALAVFRRSHGMCLRCGLPAQTGEPECFGCAVDGAGE